MYTSWYTYEPTRQTNIPSPALLPYNQDRYPHPQESSTKQRGKTRNETRRNEENVSRNYLVVLLPLLRPRSSQRHTILQLADLLRLPPRPHSRVSKPHSRGPRNPRRRLRTVGSSSTRTATACLHRAYFSKVGCIRYLRRHI